MKRSFIVTLLLTATIFTAQAETFSLMTYNLENLFDTEHDAGKADWTYMPLKEKLQSEEAMAYCNSQSNYYYQQSCLKLDWSESVLRQKILNLASVIKNYDDGKGADILVFEEVENIKVLKKLVEIGLPGMGYKSISLIEGPDSRGIDVGMISRFPIVLEKAHYVDLSDLSAKRKSETRPILQVTYLVNNKLVTVFGNHWPSQANTSEARFKAAEVLYREAKKCIASVVLAAGDFNTIDEDLPHGINEVLLENSRTPYFFNAEYEAEIRGIHWDIGSHWYRGVWSTLDKIFVLKNKNFYKVTPLWKTYNINAPDFALSVYDWIYSEDNVVRYEDIPLRFNPETGKGYSDHLGVAMKFKI